MKMVNFSLRKSAVPEYIWYISLIIIAVTLVFGVISLANRANKESIKTVPKIRDINFNLVITPLNELRLVDLRVLGIDKEDLNNFYFFCEGKYFRLSDEINVSSYFSKDLNNYLTLIREFNINLSKYNFSEECGKENAKWLLFYGEPGENAAKLAEALVEYRSFR
ncbi:MAG TPA: hypothetical protein EYH54_06010 [Nautiliaceae bacterium]|nr:hypothetical protein [Nautiliaceae bacterium]